MKYLYLSCLGNFFETDHELSRSETYCEQCGDIDEFIGKFETETEKEQLKRDHFIYWNEGD